MDRRRITRPSEKKKKNGEGGGQDSAGTRGEHAHSEASADSSRAGYRGDVTAEERREQNKRGVPDNLNEFAHVYMVRN